MLASCGGNTGGNSVELQQANDSIKVLKEQIVQLNQKIDMLEYPASQRLKDIKSSFAEENYAKAQQQISELKNLFPNSDEVKETASISENITKKLAEIEAEKQRIKALGFKALKPQTTVQVAENKVTFSSPNVGAKYIHDVYPTYSGSEWREHTADRGTKFISFAMDITSTSKDPNIPTVAFYAINGETLSLVKPFWVNFARWSDYGTYLGNEPDLKNDFSKVSTVKFKVGAQIEDSYLSKPYMVVLKKANTLSRSYDRFENPPVSYVGEAGYPSSLRIEDFNSGQYVPIKIANL